MIISMQVALAVEVDRLRKERDFLGESYDKVCREYVECENLLIKEQQENDRLRAELAECKRDSERYRDALVSIEEYWNRECNSCLHAVNTAQEALAAKE